MFLSSCDSGATDIPVPKMSGRKKVPHASLLQIIVILQRLIEHKPSK